MRYLAGPLLVIFAALISSSPVFAKPETARGLVTTATCPFSCRDAGVPVEFCRQSQNGSKCTVEDLRQAPGHRTMYRMNSSTKATADLQKKEWRDSNGTWANIPAEGAATATNKPKSGERGMVTSAKCPYDCQMAGLASDICRQWRSGSTCHVEDLTQAPGHRTMYRARR